MTGRELIDEVLKLGLKSQAVYPVENESIYVGINRAIDEVSRLCPIVGTAAITNCPVKPTVYRKGITVHRGGYDITIDASGIRSLAFCVSGSGSAVLSADGTDAEYVFTWCDVHGTEIKRGFILSLLGEECLDVHLRFTGDFTYMIQDISFFSETTSDIEEDIMPYSVYVRYDLDSSLYTAGRFLDFAPLPIRYNDTKLISLDDCKIEGSAIYLPADKAGIYEVQYYKKPTHTDADNADSEIDVDSRLSDLLAPRAAYWFYLVTDREVADRCLREYERLYSIVMATLRKVRTPLKFRDRRGWIR